MLKDEAEEVNSLFLTLSLIVEHAKQRAREETRQRAAHMCQLIGKQYLRMSKEPDGLLESVVCNHCAKAIEDMEV